MRDKYGRKEFFAPSVLGAGWKGLTIVSLIIIVTVTLLTVFIFIKKEKITTITTTSINTVTTITTTIKIQAEGVVSFREEEQLKPIYLVGD